MNDEDFIEDSYLDPSTENGSHTISPQEQGLPVQPTLEPFLKTVDWYTFARERSFASYDTSSEAPNRERRPR